jgi:subtilisin-like proprotein convertase family protein
LPITDNDPLGVSTTITVADNNPIAGMTVDLDISHTWVGDLIVTLESPGGTTITLIDQMGVPNTTFGCQENNLNITLDDTAADPIEDQCVADLTGTFLPQEALSTFDTENMMGDWILTISDNAGGDTGQLNTWCLNFAAGGGGGGNPPLIVCPSDISVDNEPGVCEALVNFSDAVAFDPEDGPIGVTQITGPPSGSSFPVGDTLIEFEATDSDGNTVTCGFTITVNDIEDPTITCPADVVADNDAGLCGANVTVDPPVISDNCPLTGPPAPPVIVGPVTDYLFNGSGLIDTPTTLTGCVYSVGGDVTMDVNYNGDWGSTIEDFMLNGPDGNQIFFNDQQSGGDCFGWLDTFTIAQATWDNWIDTFGSDLTFTLLTDASVDSGVCPDNFYQLTATLGAPAAGTIINDYNGTDDASDFYPVGTTTVTWTLIDDSGNSVQCTMDVTVNDIEPPVISCVGEPGVFSIQENFDAGLPGNWSTVVNTGPCDWINSGDMPIGPDFPTPAMIFDDDACGNGQPPSNASLLSAVYDNSGAATATLGYDVAHQEISGDVLTVEVWDGAAWQQIAEYTSDLGSILTESFDVSAYVNANFQVRWTYDDGGGWGWGSGVDNFVLDYDIPGGAPLVVELDANGVATVNANDLITNATDNCGVDTISIGGGGGAPGSITTLFASDNGGSTGGAVYFDVTVGPEDIVLYELDLNTAELGPFTVDVYTLVGTYAGNETDPGAWTLQTSGSGDSAGDDLPSNAVLDDNITLLAGESYGMALVLDAGHGHEYTNGNGSNENYDNGEVALSLGSATNVPFSGTPFSPRVWNGTLYYTLGSAPANEIEFTCDDLGINEIEITATDIYGNTATCMATVEVVDVTSPILVCADVTIELDEDGVVEIDPLDLLAYSTVTYEVITISSDNQSGSEGFTDFTVNVTDPDTVSFDWDYDTPDGPAFDSFGYLLNGVYTELTDPNGGLQQSGNSGPINVAPGDVFGFRSYSIDGIFGAATTTISNFVPGFEGQFDPANWELTLINSDGDAYFVEIPGGPLSFDACGITILAVDITEVTCADIGGTPVPGSIMTLYGSDNGGSPGGAVYFDVTVGADDIAITDIDINTAGGSPTVNMDVYTLEGTYVGNEGNPGAWTMQTSGTGPNNGEDNPSPIVLDDTVTLSAGVTYGMAFHEYTNGTGGNQNYDNGEVALSLGAASNVPFDGSPFSPRVWNGSLHYNVGGGQGGNPIVITVFASDASGNIASCQSTVTVVDLLGPEIVCPEDQTHDPGPGNLYWEVPDYWANGEASATDNCTDPVTVTSQDPAPGTLLPDGVYTVTMCAEDQYGNESCCTFELTIESILGLGDNELSNAIAMYPNPADNIVTIANSSNILLDTAMIYDVNGKLVSQIDLQDMQEEKVIDVSTLASGVYMVQITGEQSTVVKRLIKE